MYNILPKIKHLVGSKNNSSYKYLLMLSILNIFNGKREYTFKELFRFIVPFYFNMAVKHKIVEKAGGKLPKVIQNICDYSDEKHLLYIFESDFEFLCKQNLMTFFSSPVSCLEPNSSISRMNGKNSFFTYSLKEQHIKLEPVFYNFLRDKNLRDVAQDVVYLGLVNFLEKYNTTPNIYSKISSEIVRKDLSTYKKFFKDKNSPAFTDICYICGQKLSHNIAIDHFIPFSYVATDELWNLMPSHPACNCSKNDSIGSFGGYENLILRNKKFYEIDKSNIYFPFLKKELFDKYPTFNELKETMLETYESCKSIGYRQLKSIK